MQINQEIISLHTTDSNGKVLQSYTYSGYQENLSGKDAVNSFMAGGRFGGQTDSATELTYFWNRWYDSKMGKWLNEDPIRWQSDDSNFFAFVANSPSTLFDFSGLCSAVFHRSAGTLDILNGAGIVVKTCKAANNSPNANKKTNPYLDGGKGPAPLGTFPMGTPVQNSGSNGNSNTGAYGPYYFRIILPIQYPLQTPRAQVGLHSGQATVPDQAGRKGPEHGTLGCVRTTDDCTKALWDLYQAGDIFPWTMTIAP